MTSFPRMMHRLGLTFGKPRLQGGRLGKCEAKIQAVTLARRKLERVYSVSQARSGLLSSDHARQT